MRALAGRGEVFFLPVWRWTTFILIVSSALFSCESQTFKQGKILYEVNCANCHGLKGEGLGALIPPLAQSDYLTLRRSELACTVRKGMTGEVVVNGKKYNANAMPANDKLTDFEIANILNYVNNAWSADKKFIPLDDVREQLKKCE